MFMNMVFGKSIKITAWLLLGVLVVGPIACSLTFGHMWVHASLGNSPCLIESLISSLQVTSPDYLAVFLGLMAWWLTAIFTKTSYLQDLLRSRLPAALFWPYNSWLLPQNYILVALQQGILHPRVH